MTSLLIRLVPGTVGRSFLIGVLFTLVGNSLFAQNVGINESGNSPDPSAILDVDSDVNNDKGMLLPRLTTAQRNSISSPAQSLLIYSFTGAFYSKGQYPTRYVACNGSS